MCGWALCVCLVPADVSAYLLKNETQGTNLSIFGLGMVRFNYATVNGAVIDFEDSADGFADGWDTEEFLSLVANGTIWHDYTLDGFARYEDVPEDSTDANVADGLTFLLRLARDESFVAVGDQPAVFQETYYTSYTNPFRGLTLHGENEHGTFGVTTFAAMSKGASQKEDLLPNGTSGPYQLQYLPVVPASDWVTLEVRNRHDPQQVLEQRPQERNVDYVIDYDTGEITFTEPVATETFQGDPLVIVVSYRSEAESSSFETAIAGARVFVSPTNWLDVGVTHVSEFERRGVLRDNFDARQEVYGIEAAMRLADSIEVTTEFAQSQDHQAADSPSRQALRVGMEGGFGEKVSLAARYHRNERDFLTFANSAIDPNEQELEFTTAYALNPKHTLQFDYRFFQDNLPQNAAEPTNTTHRPSVSWIGKLSEATELYSNYEWIQHTDDRTPTETDDRTHVFLLGARHEFANVPVFKKMAVRGEYQFDDFTDLTDQEADTQAHQIGLRLSAEPRPKLTTYLEQKERLLRDQDRRQYTEREDLSEIGFDWKNWERFGLRASYQYRTTFDLDLQERTKARQTVLIAPEMQLLSSLQLLGKFELSQEEQFATTAAEPLPDGETSPEPGSLQLINLEGRVLYTPLKDLAARLTYQYTETVDEYADASETWSDETEFRVNYAFDQRQSRLVASILIERDLLDAPPTAATRTRTTTYFVSAFRQITDRWDGLAQYKRETVEEGAHNYREDILGEVGREWGRFFKLVGGYQYSFFHDQAKPENDYIANSVYFRLIGKL